VVRVGAEVVPRRYTGAEGAAKLGVVRYLVGPRFLGGMVTAVPVLRSCDVG
jgi:hypothetical protein